MNKISSIALFSTILLTSGSLSAHPGHTALDSSGLVHFILQPDHLPLNLICLYAFLKFIGFCLKKKDTFRL